MLTLHFLIIIHISHLRGKMKDFIKELKAANEKFQQKKKEGRCDFNIFEALKVEMKENYHSAFLAYLLDSNKGHYQNIFLEKFLELITNTPGLKTKLKNFKSENCESITTESSTYQNRRIDILMEFKNGYHIIIENKINARDQVAQIRDYVESLQGVEAKQILVIYLTRYDTDPSDDSLCKYRCRKWEIKEHKILDLNKTLKAYYLGISYKWIKKWLDECLESIEESINGKTKAEKWLNKLILCLKQYIEILESHILKTPNKKETKDILDCVMQNADFTNKALEILSKEQQECYEILKEHKNAIQDSILQDFYNAVECYCRDKELLKIGNTIWYAENDKNKGILFYTKVEGLCLYFAIRSETSACFTADAYGIEWLNTKKHKEALELIDYFKKEAKKESFNAPYHYLKDHNTFQPNQKDELELCKWIYSHAQDKDTKEKVLSKAVKEFMPLFREFATKPLIKKYVREYSKLFND